MSFWQVTFLRSAFLILGIFEENAFAQNTTQQMLEPSFIPKSAIYFSDKVRHQLAPSLVLKIEALGAQENLDFYNRPRPFFLDGILTNENLKRAIFFSVNKKLNPEYLNKIFKHKEGYYFSYQAGQQQVAVFAYKYNVSDAQRIFQFLIPRDQMSQRGPIWFWMEAASANQTPPERSPSQVSGGESVSSGSSSPGTPSGTSSGKSDNGARAQKTPLSEVFKLAMKGCGKGVIEGVLKIPMVPVHATVEFAKSLLAVIDDPDTWWDLSADQAKALAARLETFLTNPGSEMKAFSAKPPAEQSKFWCENFGVAALASAGGVGLARSSLGGTVAGGSSAMKTSEASQGAKAAVGLPIRTRFSNFASFEEAKKFFNIRIENGSDYPITRKSSASAALGRQTNKSQIGDPVFSFDEKTGVMYANVLDINATKGGAKFMWQGAVAHYRKPRAVPPHIGNGYLVCYEIDASAVDYVGMGVIQRFAFFPDKASAEAFIASTHLP